MTLEQLISQLQLLRDRNRVPSDTVVVAFGSGGNGAELELKSIHVEGKTRKFVAINCEE